MAVGLVKPVAICLHWNPAGSGNEVTLPAVPLVGSLVCVGAAVVWLGRIAGCVAVVGEPFGFKVGGIVSGGAGVAAGVVQAVIVKARTNKVKNAI